MASTVPPCGRGSVQPLWDSTKGRYVEVECPQHHHPSALRNRVPILRALMEYLPGGDGRGRTPRALVFLHRLHRATG